MNEEIKERLKLEQDCDYKRLSVDEIVILKDYITNLQNENEKTKHYYFELANKYENLIEKYLDYKSRSEKAIEFIKHNHIWYGDDEEDNEDYLFEFEDFEKLLDILQGDKNV